MGMQLLYWKQLCVDCMGRIFFGWLRFGKRKKQFLEKKNGVALLPVRNRYLWPPIRAEPGRKVKALAHYYKK